MMKLSHIVEALNSVAQKHGNAVLLGSAALAMYGLEREPHDIDVYCESVSDATTVEEHGKYSVDLTSDKGLWGRVVVTDLLSGGSILLDGVRVATPETVFILKADAAREKDIADLEMLMTVTTPDRIAERLNTISKMNSERDMFFIAENVISETVLAWPHLVDYMEMLEKCRFNKGLNERLYEVFAPQPSHCRLAA